MITPTTDAHRQLVAEYVEARKKYEALKAQTEEANALYRDALQKLAVYMQEGGLKTLRYDDLGAVTLREPNVRPNVLKENEEKLFEFVRSIGRSDAIKASIHPSTLASLIKGQLSEGVTLPEFIGYYFEPSLMYRGN